ncbi:MAG TPA: DUF3617 family protein [Rhizomicrobium sp.]|jgi:hypothetical protein
MSKTLRIAFVALASVTAPVLGADRLHVVLQIKPGLWEFTDQTKVAGDTIVADTMLAHVPPAQRAQFVTQARQEMTQPHKERECITEAKFEQRISLNFPGCTRTVATNTAKAFDIRSLCRSESRGMKEDTRQRIWASSPDAVATTTHAVTTRGTQTMTMDAVSTGRWIGADCKLGDVIQQLP